MAPSHNVVLLVDTADLCAKDRVRLLCLRLLNFLACRTGPGRVRWSYRFLNSLGARCRPPRRSDLREPAHRSWGEFEEELEASWERAGQSRASQPRGSRAALTHTALMETLADLQWDRPDISSPTKAALPRRARRGERGSAGDEALKAESPSGCPAGWACQNAVFLLSPCPHTAAQLGHFTGGGGSGLQHLMERLLPRSLQSIISDKRVTLHWLDTSDWAQVWNLSDHSGYWTMVELMQHIGGRVLPSETFLLSPNQPVSSRCFSESERLQIPCDSVLNYVICNERDYRLWFPQENAVLFFTPPGVAEHWECHVTLEPISMNQKQYKSLITIKLKGIVQHWSQSQANSLNAETWILQNSSKDTTPSHLLELLHTLQSRKLHMAADVFTEEDLCPSTGILTPLSDNAATLTVVCNSEACELDKLSLYGTPRPCDELSSDLPDIVSSVLTNISIFSEGTSTPDLSLPEWVNRELSQDAHWSSSVVEKWYSLSGSSGVSSFLMESFRLINAGSEDDQNDPFKCDQEMTQHLSEYYQMKSTEDLGISAQGENPKKRLPRTPVRQKMKTMPRALQMLNAARLNVKAQKSDNLPAATNEKHPQVKRSSDKLEERVKKALKPIGVTSVKSEEELYTLLHDDYEQALSVQDDALLTCAKKSIATLKSYHNGQDEVDCVDKIKKLLKTSKTIRQLYSNNQQKETKIRACQMQVFLRLEMCAQCPAVQTQADELEQIIEEITDMLRIISLTEDPSFLTKFLDENVLTEYISSMPKILGEIYFSLGTQIPEDLALLLPSDCDDSVSHEDMATIPSQSSISRVPSVPQPVTEAEQLEDLRTRSAKKRRSSTVVRHRSIAESSQIMRQIEVPKKLTNKENFLSNPVVVIEKLKYPLPAPPKDVEVKARRNLFENRTPTKKCQKMPRSQSVSAVEDLKHKRSKSNDGTKDLDHYKLLTKKVSETPVRRQTSNRLLYKQIKGRLSESTSNISIVEESPEKDIKEIDVRRSPRLKRLAIARRSSFYASQPKSRNLERVNSFTQQLDHSANHTTKEIKSPKELLFGEVLKIGSPPAARRCVSGVEHNSKARRKTKKNTPTKVLDVPGREGMPRKPPRTPKTPTRMSERLRTPSKSSSERKKAARNLGKLFSPSKLKDPFECETPKKASSPDEFFVGPLTKPKGQTVSLVEEIPQAHSTERTPTRRSRVNPTVQQGIPTTPTKSPFKLLESAVCSTPSRYEFRTPQKPVNPSVSKPLTPKHVAALSSRMCHGVIECTPKKQILFSPVKHSSLESLVSSNHTPQRTFSKSPSGKAYSLENISAFPCDNCTPQKLLLENQSHAVQFKSPEPTSKVMGVEENPDAQSVSEHVFQSTSQCSMDSSQTSAPALVSIISPTAAPVPRDIIFSPCLKAAVSSKRPSPKCRVEPIVLCERLDLSSLESTLNTDSFISGSQTEESIDIADALVLSTEPSKLKMKVLVTRKPSDTGLKTDLPKASGENILSSSPYGLRCTPDRRQREAAARLGPQQIPSQFSTPKSRRCLLPSDIPTYEVELEMQASGLPKLRFKRTDSSSTVDLETGNRIESPHVAKKKKATESPFAEKWCTKHATKLDSICTSPCLRTSLATPGKCSLQTLICQSYTPNRGTANTSSPVHTDVGIPWTPSPQLKERNSSDVLNNWPRRKKASALHSVLKGDKNQEFPDLPPAEGEVGVSVSKEANQLSVGDFEFEGVSELLEKSPILQWQGKRDSEVFILNSRKRSLEFLSPTKDSPHSKKPRFVGREPSNLVDRTEISSPYKSLSSHLSSSQHSSCDDALVDSGFTPPNKILNTLSTSGLFTLTQSPLLYKGKTPLSKRKMEGNESEHSTPNVKRQTRQTSDSDDSPFSKGVPVRTTNRTYSRKRFNP
uniref:TOPBP1 interacting checkpoint and replication regulator n=1 Tax=Leptobrachium leishanense TaxID=445787 RepID=A0A8C5MI57_9ANUR